MLPALDERTGLLPLGRYEATLEGIKAAFVEDPRFSASTTRTEIWQHFESATAGIRSVVPVVCVWIGGSFLTEKVDPDDIDVVYWCEDTLINQVETEQEQLLLQMFASNRLRGETGLRVDTRVCRWHLFPETHLANTAEHQNYAMERGFWDDFWMRKRSGGKGAPAQTEDALPRRGYFEVTLDGFHVS